MTRVSRQALTAALRQPRVPVTVVKAASEQRYVLGVAYPAGKRPSIGRGVDGGRDYFNPAELEKAAWGFIRKGGQIGLHHEDGTEGSATVVESYVWRGPDWTITGPDGATQTVRTGDWLIGAVLDEPSWQLYKSGRLDGFSPQGRAKRRRTI